MLRTRVRATTLVTASTLSVSHGLGTTLDAWNIVACSARARGRTHHVGTFVGPNRICISNANNSNVTVDVFCWVYQGRLY